MAHKVKLKRLHEAAVLPKAAHAGDGLDLSAVEECILQPNVPTLVKTGWAIELPPDVRAWVTPRSGLALKHGVTVANAPGLIDELYRGEVCAILLWNGYAPNRRKINDWMGIVKRIVPECSTFVTFPGESVGSPLFVIDPGSRIAQLTLSRIEPFEIAEADELSETARNASGFGSTGR